MISAYRLLDVVAMLGGAHPAPRVERSSFQVPKTSFRVSANNNDTPSLLNYLQGMDKLANWPAVLGHFQKTLVKSKKTTFASTPQGRSAPFRLLRLIARNNTTKNYTAIEANFLYAAMHIACMKELRFPADICPDLPENLNVLVRTYVLIYSVLLLSLLCHRQTLSDEDQEDLNDLRSLFDELSAAQRATDGVSFMRAPLQLALLISPIYLLLPVQHFKKSYNRHTMLSISTCLGNSKPQVLVDVETAIWKTLFSLASGMIDPFDLLHKLSDDLPWDNIHAASSMDSGWFSLGRFDILIGYILLTSFLGALPDNLSLQPSARIEVLETSPTTPNKIPQESTFELSLASAISHAQKRPAASTSSPSIVDPLLLSSSGAPSSKLLC